MRCRTVLFHPLLTYLIMLLVREKFLADSRIEYDASTVVKLSAKSYR